MISLSRWLCPAILVVLFTLLLSPCEANRYIKQPAIRDEPPSAHSIVRFFHLPTGDATLITEEDGHNILVDTGTALSAATLVRQLLLCHVHQLNTVVLTVPSPEHVGGLNTIAAAFRIDQILVSESTEREFSLERDALTAHIARKCVRSGDDVSVGNHVLMHFFGPTEPLSKQVGDRSLVFRMRVDSVTLLFTGDIGLSKETEYAKLSIQSQVLQVPDHGRSDVVSDPFLHAVNPQVAIIGGGDGSRSQLPSDELIERMMETWVEVYPITRLGTITVYCGPRSYRIVRP